MTSGTISLGSTLHYYDQSWLQNPLKLALERSTMLMSQLTSSGMRCGIHLFRMFWTMRCHLRLQTFCGPSTIFRQRSLWASNFTHFIAISECSMEHNDMMIDHFDVYQKSDYTCRLSSAWHSTLSRAQLFETKSLAIRIPLGLWTDIPFMSRRFECNLQLLETTSIKLESSSLTPDCSRACKNNMVIH